MNSLAKKPIFKILIFLILIVVAIMSLVSIYLIGVSKHFKDELFSLYDGEFMASTFAQSSIVHFLRFKDTSIEFFQCKGPSDKCTSLHDQADSLLEDLKEDLKVILERSKIVANKQTVSQTQEKMEQVKNLFEITIAKKMEAQSSSSKPIITEWQNKLLELQIEESLNSITDLEAVRGYEKRTEIGNQSDNILLGSIFALIVSVLSATYLGFAVAKRVSDALNALGQVCLAFSQGVYAQRSQVSGFKEISLLSDSFNFMGDEVETRDQEVRALLNALPDGLFFFDKTGNISIARSASITRILPDFDQVFTMEDFFNKYWAKNINEAQFVLNLVWDEASILPFEEKVFLLPQKLILEPEVGQKRFIFLTYEQQCNTKGELDKVIVIVRDKTQELEFQKAQEIEKEKIDQIQNIVINSDGFSRFISEANFLFDAISDGLLQSPYNQTALKRSLHTLKGLLGFYEFRTRAKEIHLIESSIDPSHKLETEDELLPQNEIMPYFAKTRTLFDNSVKELNLILGVNANTGIVSLSLKRVRSIMEWAHGLKDGEALHKLPTDLFRLNHLPLDFLCRKFELLLSKKMIQYPDKKVSFDVDPKSDDLSLEEFQILEPNLVHIIHNCFDHGVESASVRKENNKPEIAYIRITSKRDSLGGFTITVADDGGGINSEKLAQKAVIMNLWAIEDAETATYEEKIELIFESGLSTKDDVSLTSGRGVGMDAVKTAIEKLQGKIRVISELGKGTEFQISLPPSFNIGSAAANLKKIG